MRPPPKRTASEWADAERVLSPEASAERGPWRTSRAEYLREFMDAISDPEIPEVIGIFASQMGKTEAVNCCIGHNITDDPAPTLVVHPTVDAAETWSKDRLAPMLRDTPCLRGKVRDPKSRDSGNTILHKVFDGGHLTAVGANAPIGLSARPIRRVYGDELDRFPQSAGPEGDPAALARRRTAKFWNRKIVWTTSPGIKATSRSWRLWEKSDQRYYFVPCPDCGQEQTLRWERVIWEKSPGGEHRPETAVYACEQCGSAWSDVKRRASVRWGRWRATKPFRGIAGFRINCLYDPFESRSLADFVQEWLDCQGDPQLLKVFVTTMLAEWWEGDDGEIAEEEALLARREAYPHDSEGPMVPAGAAILTASADVQDDRIEVKCVGWGRGQECWVLERQVLYGDPSTDAVWDAVDEFFLRERRSAAGFPLFVRAWCLDTGGHHTLQAYAFVRKRGRALRTMPDGTRQMGFAVRGAGGPGKVWPDSASTKNKGKVPLYTLRVDAAKDTLAKRLGIEEPSAGFIHFGLDFDPEYFKGLTAERPITKYRRGFPFREWIKVHARNEPWDLLVYAYAALLGLIAKGLRFEHEVESHAARLAASSAPGAAPVRSRVPAGAEPPPAAAAPPSSPGASWMGRRTQGWWRR
jgi:phage terminase large subunit GpA-like protein